MGFKILFSLKFIFVEIYLHTYSLYLECSLESLKQTLLYIHYDSRSIMCWCTEQKEPEISLLFSFTVQSTEKRTKRKEIKHKETISSPVFRASILLNTQETSVQNCRITTFKVSYRTWKKAPRMLCFHIYK